MFRNLLRPDSPLMITMNNITDCIFLSLFWILGCFPVVTLGASFAALYDASYRGMRKGEKHSWQRFFHVFRTNWKAGILPTVAVLAVFSGAVFLLIKIWNAAVAQQISFMLFAAGAFLSMLILGTVSLAFPILSRFENSFLSLMRNTILLGFANLPRTLLLGILNAAAIFLCARYVFPLFFLPSLAALIGSLLIEPMFKPFMNPEETAD
ncbi:MAG: DUF624 domain-containing protein [Ruminococcaceae bacterium]|nr:DUF624 domain-containing protein [Oscillospiraceae bacterium]